MELEEVKRHMKIFTGDLEDNEISKYMKFAESSVKFDIGLQEGHEDYLENNEQYDQAVLFLTQHYYTNRLPLTDSKNSTFLQYGLPETHNRLLLGYMKWVDAYDN